jgi:hypothetical protein
MHRTGLRLVYIYLEGIIAGDLNLTCDRGIK